MSPSDDIDTLQIAPDPDKLERYHRQQLSAMLDGELPQDQARFLRRRLQHDAELAQCFERWQVCGDVLRGRRVSLLPVDFADRIAAGIAADGAAAVAATGTARRARPRLLRWGGGAALAASVALVALFVGRPGGLQDTPGGAPAGVLADASPAPLPVPADATADASALMVSNADAGAGVVAAGAVATAAMQRRTGTERSTRAQSQRAALRGAQERAVRDVELAAVPGASSGGTGRAFAPAGSLVSASIASSTLGAVDGVARPWPRASSLTADSSFSVRYGDGFAAPSWSDPTPAGSSVLPSFPVEPSGEAVRPQSP